MVVLLVGACGGSGDALDPGEAGPPPKTYTVRAQVVTLPADNNGEIRLAHEAVDDFVAASGEVVGMDAMTMAFPPADGVVDQDLAVGDIVEIDLRVDWGSETLAMVTRIAKLPAETELEFRKAEPPPSGFGR